MDLLKQEQETAEAEAGLEAIMLESSRDQGHDLDLTLVSGVGEVKEINTVKLFNLAANKVSIFSVHKLKILLNVPFFLILWLVY